ncbi:MAG: hypothetical protein Q7T25_04300, partial [Sideroxyarcus sp.]|nr:hypothetical protein [Sideroxyarcus sp.]
MEEHSLMRNIAAYDFDQTRVRQVIAALGLNADEHLTRQLRAGLAGVSVEALVDACLSKLAHHLDFSSIERNDFGVAFRQGWIDYLQYFGLGFDTSTYFVERMAFSSACARAGISLGLLHLQHSLVLQSVIELLAASEKPAQD